MVVGRDYFFVVEDVCNYINTYGNSKCSGSGSGKSSGGISSENLLLDYTSYSNKKAIVYMNKNYRYATGKCSVVFV